MCNQIAAHSHVLFCCSVQMLLMSFTQSLLTLAGAEQQMLSETQTVVNLAWHLQSELGTADLKCVSGSL